ncbi:MAG: MarC family protein [Candidatus Aenigmatarchaeota archaeon]
MLNEILIVSISLFAIVDPIASIPVFISFFGSSPKSKQRKAAVEIVFSAFFLLLIFAIWGMALLKYLNISIYAFMIAGGILLLYLSFEFLLGEVPKTRTVETEPSSAVVPIGTPLLAGPGAITSVIYFSHTYGILVTFLGILIVCLLSIPILLASTRIKAILGKNGLKIINRIMGLITAAIAISFIEKAFISYGWIKLNNL